MLKRIHINQHHIRSNKTKGTNLPVVSVKTYQGNNVGHEATILGPSKVVYSPDKPLGCGARVWIQTTAPVLLDDEIIK